MPVPEIVKLPQFYELDREHRRAILANESPAFARFDRARQDRNLEAFEAEYGQGRSDIGPRGLSPPVSRSAQASPGVMSDLSLGWRAGQADLAKSVASALSLLPGETAAELRAKAQAFGLEVMPKPEEMEGHEGFVSGVTQAIGSAPAAIVKYAPAAMSGKWAPVVAGTTGAVSHADEGLGAAAKAAVSDAAGFYLGGKADLLKGRVRRAVGSAAAQGSAAVLAGGDTREAATAALMGGAFGAASKGRTEATKFEKAGAQRLDEAAEVTKMVFAPGTRSTTVEGVRPDAAAWMERTLQANLGHMRNRIDVADTTMSGLRKQVDKLQDNTREINKARELAQQDPMAASAYQALAMAGNEKLDFIYAIQTGQYGGAKSQAPMKGTLETPLPVKQVKLSPELERGATMLREIEDNLRERIQKEGSLKEFNDNYFKNIWKEPERAQDFVVNWFHGRTPLAGHKGFLKERKYPTIYDGMVLGGLEPAATNAVDIAMLSIAEKERYLMAKSVIRELKQGGFPKIIATGHHGPSGYIPVDDAAFQIWKPRAGAYYSPTGGAEGAQLLKFSQVHKEGGKYQGWKKVEKTELGSLPRIPVSKVADIWLPEPMANVLNNYLSPGIRGNKIWGPYFRAWMDANNAVNKAQLGFSAFHAAFTSLDAVTSQMALGTMQVAEGIRTRDPKWFLKAARSAAEIPTAWYTNAFPTPMKQLNGHDLMTEMLKPGSMKDVNPRLAILAEAAREAGYSVKMDPIYKVQSANRIRELFESQHYIKGGLAAIGWLPEKASIPIMEWLVPRQKLGVFAKMAEFELERLPRLEAQAPGTIKLGEAIYSLDALRGAMQRAEASASNRMGQLPYDNLHWNKMAKDMSMMAVRAVGWNIGTFREIGGGLIDSAKFTIDALAPGQRAEFTHRMGYVIGLTTIAATIGRSLDYLMTGGAPAEDWKDYFFPRTGGVDRDGKPERVSIPTYFKDSYHYATAPGQTAKNKLNSLVIGVAEAWENEAYNRVQIVDPDDTAIQNVLDYAAFFSKSFATPFSMSSQERLKKQGASPALRTAAFFGITPAPTELKTSKAERLANEALFAELPSGAKTKAAAAKSDLRKDIQRAYRNNDNEKAEELIREAVRSGKLLPQDIMRLRREMHEDSLVRHMKEIRSIPAAIRIFEAGTDEERSRMAQAFRHKLLAPDKPGGGVWQHLATLEPPDRRKLLKRIAVVWPEFGERVPERLTGQ